MASQKTLLKQNTHTYFPCFTRHFSTIEDPRRTDRGNFLYPIEEILFLTISAVISNFKTYGQICLFGEEKLEWLRKFYQYENGIPSGDVLERFYARLDHEKFAGCFTSWVNEKANLSGEELINIDGKTVKGSAKEGEHSAIHMVSAYANENRLTLAQKAVSAKSNEITAIPALLDLLTIRGCMVTMDAMGCQKEIATKIREKKADYTLQIKENQKTLLEQVQSVFNVTPTSSENIHKDFGHGRIETRECKVITDLKFIDEKSNWEGLKSVIQVTRNAIEKKTQKERTETSYYISSAKKSAEQFNKIIRGHWAIENNLHWCLDVLFQEDKSFKKAGNSAKNFNIINKMALAMVEKEPTPKKSKKEKMVKCALNDGFREKTLNF